MSQYRYVSQCMPVCQSNACLNIIMCLIIPVSHYSCVSQYNVPQYRYLFQYTPVSNYSPVSKYNVCLNIRRYASQYMPVSNYRSVSHYICVSQNIGTGLK